VSFTPWPFYHQGKSPWYPLNRRLGGPQRQSACGRHNTNKIKEYSLHFYKLLPRGYMKFQNDFIASIAYLYTCSLLRGFNFKVLPLSSYALSPMMLPLLETFLELLLWNSFQCHCHIFWMPSIS